MVEHSPVSQLTRSIQDRLFIGSLGLIFGSACAYLLVSWHGRPWSEERDWLIRFLALIRIEGLSTVLSGSLFGVVRAIWTPDWIERRLKQAFWHFLLLVFVVGLFGTAICFYMLFIGPA